MRLKPRRRRVMAKLRDDRSNATGPNQVWAMDWMHDGAVRRPTAMGSYPRRHVEPSCPVMRERRCDLALEAGSKPKSPTPVLFRLTLHRRAAGFLNFSQTAERQTTIGSASPKSYPFGAQARTTFTATPCLCGLKVALFSESKTKLPPGLIA